MKTIKVKVLDYYNHQEFYHFMPENVFRALENAFLFDELETEVPAGEFLQMINDYNKCIETEKRTKKPSPHFYIMSNYLTSEN